MINLREISPVALDASAVALSRKPADNGENKFRGGHFTFQKSKSDGIPLVIRPMPVKMAAEAVSLVGINVYLLINSITRVSNGGLGL